MANSPMPLPMLSSSGMMENLPAEPVTLMMKRTPNALMRSRCILPSRSYVEAYLISRVNHIAYYQGLICVGTVGNAAPILIFKWERRSHTYSYFPVGTQFLQRSVTISIRPILVAQQTTILPPMNENKLMLRIKLGPVTAPDRHSNCSPFCPSPSSSPSVSPPHSPSLSGGPAPPVKHS